jgi:hypothetical protein
MSGINFKTASAPVMTAEEFETKRQQTGGKWIKEPGTYTMVVKAVSIKDPNPFDTQWINVQLALENASGEEFNTFLTIPTTAEKSFLFGSKKSLREFNDLAKFFLGLGINLDYATAIHQLSDVFSDTANLIGQTITLRLGYYGKHVKYVGKVDNVSSYIIAEKDGTDATGRVFSGFDAANAYAAEEAIKLQKFMKVLDVIPGTVLKSVSTASNDLPF